MTTSIGRTLLATVIVCVMTGFGAVEAFADGNGDNGVGQNQGNGNATTSTDNGLGNNGVNDGNRNKHEVPESPYALGFPVVALGTVAFVLYRKKRKAV